MFFMSLAISIPASLRIPGLVTSGWVDPTEQWLLFGEGNAEQNKKSMFSSMKDGTLFAW